MSSAPSLGPTGRCSRSRTSGCYVVTEGHFTVLHSRDGAPPEPVPTLGAKDWFGQIGLLERLSRTATVRSDTPCRLLLIDGESSSTTHSRSIRRCMVRSAKELPPGLPTPARRGRRAASSRPISVLTRGSP
jgi:hypothetical protein